FQEFASQVGFHRGDPAVPSHGCIHVNAGNAQTLWNWSAIGTPVIVCSGSGCGTYLGSSSSSKGKSKDTSKPKTLQRRLAAGIADDPLEREADQAADRMLAMRPDSGLGAAPLQLQRVSGQEASGRVSAPASVDGVLAQPGRPLDAAVRQDMAQRFGHDFSRVRVHTGPTAAQSARDVSADAYTVGQQIVFAAGRYAPHCLAGQHLLAHELAHTLQQSGSSAPGQAQQGLRLPSRRSQLPMRLQRRETGSGLEDPLYAADRAGSSGQGRDDRMTGRRLQNWAIARGSFVIRSDASLMRMQEKDGVESEIIDEIELLLIDLLRGHDARDPAAPEHALTGPGRNVRPEFERTRLDRFEGSDNAREMAVLELLDFWGPIASYFAHALMLRYRDSYLDAAGRTPQDMRIEADTGEIRRLRMNQLYRHEHAINQGMAGQVVFRAGQRYGRLHIADLYKTLGSRSTGPGTVWAYLDGQPLWYYSGSVEILDRNAVIGEVARGAAEAARFAAQLLPLLIKAGAFALSFSPAPLLVIASVVLDELGEEGLRDLSGEGRSFKGIAGSAAKEILLNLVLNKLMGGGEGKAASEAAGALEKVAEEAAIKMRASVEKEIVRTEEASVVKAVEAGEMRSVSDKSLVQEGFTQEVAITHEGGSHVYRRKADGEWCRWSEHRLCDLGLDHADESVQEAIVREREAMVAPGQRVSQDTGMKEVPGITGPAPVESGVSGTLGEAGHAAEVTGGRLPKKLKSIASPEGILKERDALLRGDISLREVVEKYPPEGAAQVFFPTAQGGGRFIDHVYLEESTMFVVFRESKNYRRFNLGPKELRQLQKDLAFLSHPRFKGLRIEWRISGTVNQDTLAILDQVRNDSKGLFTYVLDPGVP
ncbi:MAG: hypothetical protein JWQ80_1334, partial [Massilia sp.]|nr:hypothetical protein [Massilia sp.]